MANGVKEEGIRNDKVTEGSKSLLIPTTLLESVVDILRDHLLVDSKNSQIAHEAEILAIVAKIEVNLIQIKERLQDKDRTLEKISHPNNAKTSLFPPPPFMREKTNQNGPAKKLDEVSEEVSSTSTISSEGKGDEALSNHIDHQKQKESIEYNNLTRSMTQIGPLHERRHSRRMSLPFISQEVDVVSKIIFKSFNIF